MLTEDMRIREDGFGRIGCDIIRRYTLTNASNASVSLISFGAGIQSIKVPNKNGIISDIVLGWDDINGYVENRFIGRTIDRMPRTIIDGIVAITDDKYSLSENYYKNSQQHLNGEFIGFDNVNWDCYIMDKSVVMCYLKRDDSEEYSSDMLIQIKYTWSDENELFINIRATTTRSTAINISNHCLLNLAGQGTGSSELNRHIVTVNSDKCVSANVNEVLPIVESVDGTIFDLRKPTILSPKILRQVIGGGFDHTFYVNSPSIWCYRFHARVLHPKSGRFVEVYSNQPAIHLFTANNFPNSRINNTLNQSDIYCDGYDNYILFNDRLKKFDECKTLKLWGKGRVLYTRHCGLLISPQNYSNYGNMKYFPSCVLHPGNVYQHDMSLKFGVKD